MICILIVGYNHDRECVRFIAALPSEIDPA